MFIATNVTSCALQRSAMSCRGSIYIPLLTERKIPKGERGYKHVAPPEQRDINSNEAVCAVKTV